MARNTRRVKGGRKRMSPEEYQAFCRKQVLAGLTTDATGAWVRAGSGIMAKHLQAGYKAGG